MLYRIKRRKGEYVLSMQIENDDDKFVCINQKFDKVHHNEIIPIVFSQIKKVAADDEGVNKLDFIKYRCFIGGSTAITNERNATRAVLSILYNQYEKYNFFITSHTFEVLETSIKLMGISMNMMSSSEKKQIVPSLLSVNMWERKH